MATKVFILIETAVGQTREVANTLKGVSGVQSADVVTGPYDVIAVIDAPDCRWPDTRGRQYLEGC